MMHIKVILLPGSSYLKIRNALLLLLAFSLGLLAQDTDRIDSTESNVPQAVQLSHLEINGEFIDFKRLSEIDYRHTFAFGDELFESFDSVASRYNYPYNLNLPHHINNLTFHFSAIDWKSPHRIRYSCTLEGYDKDWSDQGTSAKVEYQDLPHGNYTFKVKAIGEAQIWSDPYVYELSIRRPWWISWWAYMMYAIVVGSVSFWVLHIWQERKRQEAEIHQLLEAYKLTDLPKALEMKKRPHQSSFLTLVQTTLETHLSDENFGIAELCDLLNISRAQLHRKLKKLTGLSTSHYIRSLRLEIAKDLLQTSNLNISEVAFKVGFSSASYFSKVFKTQYGHAPSELS